MLGLENSDYFLIVQVTTFSRCNRGVYRPSLAPRSPANARLSGVPHTRPAVGKHGVLFKQRLQKAGVLWCSRYEEGRVLPGTC